MSDPYKTNRRCFIKAISTSSAALVLGFHLPVAAKPGQGGAAPAKGFVPNAYLRIDPDGTVTVTVTKSEIGQGVRTSLPMIVAEELEADWSRVVVTQATTGLGFKSLGTGGSWAIGGNWTPLRTAGATAREMLVSAAAAAWSVDRATCRAEKGSVVHAPTGRRLGYGELAEAASKLQVPTNPPLKDPKNYTIIGTRRPRIDGRPIVTGTATFGLDVRLPGMKFATILRSPVMGGKVAKWDDKRAMTSAGVRAVVPVSSGLAAGVAVVADSTWAAFKGREALDVTWDNGPNAAFDGEAFRKKLEESSHASAIVTRKDAVAAGTSVTAARSIEATYEYPFQAHATLEPMNCVADVRDGRTEIWAPTQAPDRIRERVAALIKQPAETITVHVTMSGGGFGRRLGVDYALEAAEVSMAVKSPVQVIWSREDDMRHGHFQPASANRMTGGVDAKGAPVAWKQVKAGSYLSIFGPPSAAERASSDYWRDASWGCYDNPYSIPGLETGYVPVDSPVPTGPWRAVYSPSCSFARESFVDELAHAAGRDPLEFRLSLLDPAKKFKAGNLNIDQGRLRSVLALAAEKAQWTRKLPPGWGRGIAGNVYDGDTCLAYVAEASTGKDGSIRVERMVCAVDCGIVINPSGVEAQIEGGIAFGLSTVIGGEITIRAGRVEQSSFLDYPVIRMDQMPKVEIHIVPSTASPTGMGEPPVPPVAPAVTNAIFNATGKRIRRLPVRLPAAAGGEK
ncbi:MAG: xanthine dehydrogenase family protein molybdopterin-binding subunit [Blastocatellia bacterium]|nr:xanthine dehydrogenase family protein molybdopterin-binding subunit [Blastocatellia bacterium]